MAVRTKPTTSPCLASACTTSPNATPKAANTRAHGHANPKYFTTGGRTALESFEPPEPEVKPDVLALRSILGPAPVAL